MTLRVSQHFVHQSLMSKKSVADAEKTLWLYRNKLEIYMYEKKHR